MGALRRAIDVLCWTPLESKFIFPLSCISQHKTEKEMAAGDPEDLASIATRAEERLETLESAVFKEREEVKERRERRGKREVLLA